MGESLCHFGPHLVALTSLYSDEFYTTARHLHLAGPLDEKGGKVVMESVFEEYPVF